MNKLESDHDLYSVNQVTIALLLLAMVLMKDSIDNDTVQAICLTCILSLIIKEVESNQDKDSVSGMSGDMITADSSEALSTDPVTETVEEFPDDSTPEHQFQEESEAPKNLGPNPEIPSTRRLIDAYSSIPSGKEINYHQGITWKDMPPKSIVPTKHSSNKEFHNLSIRFTE